MTGAADNVLPSMFEGRIHREESRPVTLGELLMGLQSAKQISEDLKLREQIAKERRKLMQRRGLDSPVVFISKIWKQTLSELGMLLETDPMKAIWRST